TGSTVAFESSVTGTAATFTGPGLKIFDGGAAPSAVVALNTIIGSTRVTAGTTLNAQSLNENAVDVAGILSINGAGTRSTNSAASLTLTGSGTLDLNQHELLT